VSIKGFGKGFAYKFCTNSPKWLSVTREFFDVIYDARSTTKIRTDQPSRGRGGGERKRAGLPYL